MSDTPIPSAGGQPPEPPPVVPVETGSPRSIDTENTRLDDGVNRCPACGSTDVQLRASSSKLMCLFCRHEWSEQKVESIVAGDVEISELTGTQVGSGAADIAAGAADVLTLKCGGRGRHQHRSGHLGEMPLVQTRADHQRAGAQRGRAGCGAAVRAHP
jgi:hypothetical protein